MIFPSQIPRVIVLVALLTSTLLAQDDPSHRPLGEGGTNDFQGARMRLELLQRLQRIAKDRQERGQPPLDMSKLPTQVKQAIDRVKSQDEQIRQRLQGTQPPAPGSDRQPRQPGGDNRQQNLSNQRRPQQPATSQPKDNQTNPAQRKQFDDAVKDFYRKQRERTNGGNSRNTQPDRTNTRRSNQPSQPGQTRRSNQNRNSSDVRSPNKPRQPGTGSPDTQARNRTGRSTETQDSSQRTLSQDEIDNFDIDEYIRRLKEQPPQTNPNGTPSRNKRAKSSGEKTAAGQPRKKRWPRRHTD